MSPALVLNNSAVDIIDIRVKDSGGFSAVDAIQDGLDPPQGKARSFPTLLLYDTVGLRLFEEITYLDEYYLTNTEIQTLETHARTIAERLPENSQIVELGSGCVLIRLWRANMPCQAADGTVSLSLRRF
jgi:uncharacterized SAM-dependent methyltransferase